MSPSTVRSRKRQRNQLLFSLGAVVILALGAFGAVLAAKWTPKLGLDLAGGAEVIYKPAHQVSPSDLTTAVNIMRNRANASGVTGSDVSTQGNDIVVELPGVKNADQLIKTIGNTAEMLFRPVLCFAPPYEKTKGTKPPAPSAVPSSCSSSSYDLTAANLAINTSTGEPTNQPGEDPTLAAYPTTTSDYDSSHPKSDVILPASADSGFKGLRYLLGPVGLTGSAIKSAQAGLNQTNAWVVDATLTGAGSPKWDTMAEANFHQYIAIDLDGQVISAPLTQPSQAGFTSFDGSVEISGNFNQNSAQSLSLDLNYGALPVRLVQLTKETVSATLGKASLKAGLYAGLGGLVLVLLYMILYYRGLGLVVVLGLATTSLLLWAIVSALSHSHMNLTLDLAGVTGVIVSIGITADSYVIYFERLKDQARAGRSLRATVERTFTGAFRTVFTADLVSLIGALVLYILAVGDVKGFAFMLGLSTLMNILITYFFTRPVVILMARSRMAEFRFLGLRSGLSHEGTA